MCDEVERFDVRLGNQGAIERVTVMVGQVCNRDRVFVCEEADASKVSFERI
jgi:hypothetical protein